MYAYTYAGHKNMQYMHTRVLSECQGRCTSEVHVSPVYIYVTCPRILFSTHIPKYVQMLYANIRNLGQLKKSKKYTNEM